MLKKRVFFAILGKQMIFKCFEDRWVCAPEIMVSNDTILILWRSPKLKWQSPWVLAKNPKMSKNKIVSKFTQFWWASPSRLFRNMSRSSGQNSKPRGVFLLFSHPAPSLSSFESFLVFFFVAWHSRFGEEIMAPCLGEAASTWFWECPSWYFCCCSVS